jgi:hypothetical protein
MINTDRLLEALVLLGVNRDNPDLEQGVIINAVRGVYNETDIVLTVLMEDGRTYTVGMEQVVFDDPEALVARLSGKKRDSLDAEDVLSFIELSTMAWPPSRDDALLAKARTALRNVAGRPNLEDQISSLINYLEGL